MTIYLWRKINCFVCFVPQVQISQTTMLLLVLLVLLERPWWVKGAPSWFHNVLNYCEKVQLNIEQNLRHTDLQVIVPSGQSQQQKKPNLYGLDGIAKNWRTRSKETKSNERISYYECMWKAWRGKRIQAWTHEYFMYGNTLKCSWFFIKQDYGNGEPRNKPRDHLKQTLSSFICEDHES